MLYTNADATTFLALNDIELTRLARTTRKVSSSLNSNGHKSQTRWGKPKDSSLK